MKRQKIYFELIKIISFNNFNGKKIVKDLKKHSDYWEIFVPYHSNNEMNTDFKIREVMNNDEIYIDTLLIKINLEKIKNASRKKRTKIFETLRSWKYDEIEIIIKNDSIILNLWFD